MKQFLILACSITTAVYYASAADQRIAFERDNSIYIANISASLVRKLGDGTFPAISPDSKTVAFTIVPTTTGQSARRPAIVTVNTGQVHIFGTVPGDSAYHCAWSPDGAWIAFSFQSDNLWRLALIRADATDFKFVRKDEQDKLALYSPCWARDGKSIFCHDTTTIYRLALDGSVMVEWKIGRIVPNGALSADGRLDISPDGKRLLLSVDMDEAYTRPDWDGPVPALWSFDLATEAAVRLTSKDLFAWDGCWLDDVNLLFVSQRSGDRQAAIYRTNGKQLIRLIENGRYPTVSRP
ncbi:MAG TPA: hypothetical protein VJ719_01520 [Chthoniobacterales bacterium]|nr:hypothetical protein [Chthoniobacterales bacterium]